MTDPKKEFTIEQAVDKMAQELIEAFSVSSDATEMAHLIANTNEIKRLIHFTLMLGEVFDVTAKRKPEWMIPMTIMGDNAIYIRIKDMDVPASVQDKLIFSMQHISQWKDAIPAAELKLHSFLQQEHDKIGEK